MKQQFLSDNGYLIVNSDIFQGIDIIARWNSRTG